MANKGQIMRWIAEEVTQDLEPHVYVIEWEKMFLQTGPASSYEYDDVGFLWTTKLAYAQEYPQTIAKKRTAYYQSLNINCHAVLKDAVRC